MIEYALEKAKKYSLADSGEGKRREWVFSSGGLENLIFEVMREFSQAEQWTKIEELTPYPEMRILATNGISQVICYWNGEAWINERSALGDVYPATHYCLVLNG